MQFTQNVLYWLRHRYRKILNSIAFYPALIGFCFLLLSIGVLYLDYSGFGEKLTSGIDWLTLKDSSTARSIVAAIVTGIISLTVFSFSMVMIVLNQAASNMSNRVLDKLIGNRFQQVVLGIYIGTIVYALFLLSNIRDIDSGLQVPVIGIYLLICITIFDIFLFIYFLHYITQSVKYEVITQRLYESTREAMRVQCDIYELEPDIDAPELTQRVCFPLSGIYCGFGEEQLVTFCEKHDLVLRFMHPPGTFVLSGSDLLVCNKPISADILRDLMKCVLIQEKESIEDDYVYGLQQLKEIANRALSPGINDQGTAIVALRSLFTLLAKRLRSFPKKTIYDSQMKLRILPNTHDFESLVRLCVFPVWHYGKDDPCIQREMRLLITQLNTIQSTAVMNELLGEVEAAGEIDN